MGKWLLIGMAVNTWSLLGMISSKLQCSAWHTIVWRGKWQEPKLEANGGGGKTIHNLQLHQKYGCHSQGQSLMCELCLHSQISKVMEEIFFLHHQGASSQQLPAVVASAYFSGRNNASEPMLLTELERVACWPPILSNNKEKSSKRIGCRRTTRWKTTLHLQDRGTWQQGLYQMQRQEDGRWYEGHSVLLWNVKQILRPPPGECFARFHTAKKYRSPS